MKIKMMVKSIDKVECDALIVTVIDGGDFYPELETLDNAMGGDIKAFINDNQNVSKYKSMRVIETFGRIAARRVIVAGLGKESDLKKDKIRPWAAEVSRFARGLDAKRIAMVLPHHACSEGEYTVAAITEGIELGLYEFKLYKTPQKDEKEKCIDELIFIAGNNEEQVLSAPIVQTAKMVAENVNAAREIINLPPHALTPKRMAEYATEIAQETGMEITVFNKMQMEEMQMGGIIGVAKGSEEPPKMIVLKYHGNKDSEEWTAYVGKGITYDSGGLSLKPTASMANMKTDMAGAASTLFAMKTIAELKLKINIMGILPCTENMPSGGALKPGEIIRAMNGKTIEVQNTDAEGRLILADAVAYAAHLGAKRIVDIATLTGAVSNAIGNRIAGLLSNNDELCDLMLKAARNADEWMWRFPVHPEYREELKSDCADLKNTGAPGVILGGIFIEEFVDKLPWVHIDIAGVARAEKTKGEIIKGGTGVGIRTLINFAQLLSEK